jgi:hypothetical protein
MKKLLFALIAVSFLATSAYAVNISIEGNGADSHNSATIDQNSNQTIQQRNSATVTNDINSTANTGNNNVSGNSNGNSEIITGNATVKTNVINTLNSNNAEVTCNNCTTPTAKPTQTKPTPTSPSQPTATPTPGQGDGDGDRRNDGGDGGIGGANISVGGEVMGLSATGGESTQQFFTVVGTICIFLGSVLFNLKRRYV